MGSPFWVSGRVRHRAMGILTCMSEWLIFAGYLVIALTAWSLDGNARGTAEDARLKAFVDQDRRSAVVEPDAVERLGPPAPRRVEAGPNDVNHQAAFTAPLFVPGGRPSAPLRAWPATAWPPDDHRRSHAIDR
jgi:hypothetical protein